MTIFEQIEAVLEAAPVEPHSKVDRVAAELAEALVLQDYEHDPLPPMWFECQWPGME